MFYIVKEGTLKVEKEVEIQHTIYWPSDYQSWKGSTLTQ